MRKKHLIWALLLGFVLIGAAVWGYFFWPAPHISGPLRQEAYVWQRSWTKPVQNAVSQHGSNFAALTVLKTEISWKDRQPQLARANVDYDSLTQTHRPVGLALRIGPYPGPFTNDAIATFIIEAASRIVAEARTNGITPAELQLDFDCAESKLDGYRVWVEAIQRRVAPTPVTITALPSWLNARAFKRLAAVATNYVLQVHSVARPKDYSAPFTLCDPAVANRAMERAGRLGIPFRVALPTYGYTLAFAADGKFIGLSAEGPRPSWPTNALLREITSDAVELGELVRAWTTSRPEALRGVIWYRLPTIVDNFNWRWPTLGAILDSRVPLEKFSSRTRRVEAGLVEITLVNSGELDISSRLAVEVRWRNARLMAGDAQRGFELAERRSSAARFQTRSQPVRLRAGDQLVVGWLRFDPDCEVQCEVKKL